MPAGTSSPPIRRVASARTSAAGAGMSASGGPHARASNTAVKLPQRAETMRCECARSSREGVGARRMCIGCCTSLLGQVGFHDAPKGVCGIPAKGWFGLFSLIVQEAARAPTE